MVGWWTHSPTGLRFDILEAAQQAAQQDSSRSRAVCISAWERPKPYKDFRDFLRTCASQSCGILWHLLETLLFLGPWDFRPPSPCCSFFCSIHFCQMGGELESRDSTEGLLLLQLTCKNSRKAAGFLFFNCLFWTVRTNFCQTQWIALPNIFMSTSEKSILVEWCLSPPEKNDVICEVLVSWIPRLRLKRAREIAKQRAAMDRARSGRSKRNGWCVSCIKLWSSVTGLS